MFKVAIIGHLTLCSGADLPTLFPGSLILLPPGAEVSPKVSPSMLLGAVRSEILGTRLQIRIIC